MSPLFVAGRILIVSASAATNFVNVKTDNPTSQIIFFSLTWLFFSPIPIFLPCKRGDFHALTDWNIMATIPNFWMRTQFLTNQLFIIGFIFNYCTCVDESKLTNLFNGFRWSLFNMRGCKYKKMSFRFLLIWNIFNNIAKFL